MKAALLLLLVLPAVAQDRTGSIIGVVSDSVSHQPLRKVRMSLTLGDQPLAPQATTDDAGAFAFHDLKPGQYRLTAERPDYPTWQAITVSPSHDPEPVDIELVPGAVVSGRILDEDGDPLPGCSAQARRVEHPEQIVSHSDAKLSEYRLFGLLPAKYTLAVQCDAPAFQPRPFSAGPDPPPSLAYPLQFYPAAPDAASAETMQLTAGTETAGVDFRMRTAHVTQVRAVIAPSSADWHGRDLFGGLIRPGDFSGNEFRGMMPDSSGAFRFPQVFPGSYVLLVTTLDRDNRIGAVQRVEVKDQPVNTVIELKHAPSIHGTVELESTTNSTSQLTEIAIQLISEYPQFFPVEDASVKQDGSFTINSVPPIQWRLYANAFHMGISDPRAAVFVKSVWLGSKELSGHTIDLSSGSADTLKIVLSANTASIHGTAPPGMIVACRNLDDEALSSESPAVEQSGEFRIQGLAPGRYRVAAGESADDIPKDQGRDITVQEGESATVDLTN
jgi:Carboxypeptidase regulatory-like domain